MDDNAKELVANKPDYTKTEMRALLHENTMLKQENAALRAQLQAGSADDVFDYLLGFTEDMIKQIKKTDPSENGKSEDFKAGVIAGHEAFLTTFQVIKDFAHQIGPGFMR